MNLPVRLDHEQAKVLMGEELDDEQLQALNDFREEYLAPKGICPDCAGSLTYCQKHVNEFVAKLEQR